jgi:hypothetical protein
MTLRHVTMAVGAAALIAVATPAHAQVWNDGARQGTYRNDAQSVAFNNGYQQGLRDGEQAVRDRRPLDVNRERDYRNADQGYRRDYGERNFYRDEFRRGFAQGYQEAFQRVNRYDDRRDGRVYGDRDDRRGYGDRDDRRGYGAGAGFAVNIAFRNGVGDGYQKGLDDARDGKYPQPERQKWYRQGDRNFNGRDGISRDEYKNEYRRGFQEGYARAYNERRR